MRKKHKGNNIIFILSMSIFIVALLALGIIVAGYVQGCVSYKNLADSAVDIDDNDALDITKMKVNWEELLAINPDTVAWVYIPGTNINYPVVHTNNNETYLHTSFRGNKTYVSYGSIFVDCHDNHDLSNQNIVTYGHNMNDGLMYGDIANYKNSQYLNDHKYIYFLTPQGNYKLSAFTCCHVAGNERIIQVDFTTEESMVNYINDKINRGVAHLQPSIPPAEKMKKIFTFSTCDNSANNGRYMVFAFVVQTTVPGVSTVYD